MANYNIKFDHLTLTEDGMVLKYKNKTKKVIYFAELDKIYIKKYNLNTIFKFAFISCPFLFLYMAIQYDNLEFLIILALFTMLTLFTPINVINYKSYRLCIRLKNGTCFIKKVPLHMKIENISIIQEVYTEYLNYNSTIVFTSE